MAGPEHNEVTLGVVQFACSDDAGENLATASRLVREAAKRGANVVLVQELFEGLYFCQEQAAVHFARAKPLDDAHPTLAAMRALAAELGVVIPVSLFERRNQAYYNSVVMVDDRGKALGVYRKSHIPDFPAYEEAFYFAPGDTGFRVWETKHVRLGCGVCWDQWFPETARIMALAGAELLAYPTAIGRPVKSRETQPADSKPHWQRTMQGHAAANQVPLAASNRIGVEAGKDDVTQFYGGSFVADPTGAKLVELDETTPGVGIATIDLDAATALRRLWGIYRTRRTDLYGPIETQAPPDYLRAR